MVTNCKMNISNFREGNAVKITTSRINMGYLSPRSVQGHFGVNLCNCLKWPVTRKWVEVERNGLKFGIRE